MNKQQTWSEKSKSFVLDNIVVILFAVLCVGAIIASKQPLTFVAAELFTRISRNAFLVLSLLIPVLAGMGLNFGIVIGAIAAQISVFTVVYWGGSGISGFLLCMLIATPLAILFGWMVGALFNRMKGAEMIGGMVLGYFADGLYQLLFLFIIGGVIPVNNPTLIIAGGIGVKNTIDLKDNLKYALDTVPMITVAELAFYITVIISVCTLIYRAVKKQDMQLRKWLLVLGVAAVAYGATYVPPISNFLYRDRLPLISAVNLAVLVGIVWTIGRLVWLLVVKKEKKVDLFKVLLPGLLAVVGYGLTWLQSVYDALLAVDLPVMTYLCIAALCLFNTGLMKTRLGQNMRTVGQNRVVANAAGIQVDRTRIIAMILSTVFASWGQLILLQNIGTFSTYGAHTQVGQFAIAALLVGGASVHKANNKQALIGVVLFHTLFIVAPLAGKELFGDAQIGEYFRVFVAYGVIAVSLAMYAWKTLYASNRAAAAAGAAGNPPGPAPADPVIK